MDKTHETFNRMSAMGPRDEVSNQGYTFIYQESKCLKKKDKKITSSLGQVCID